MPKELSKAEVEEAYRIVLEDRKRRNDEDAKIREIRGHEMYRELLHKIANPSTHTVIFNDGDGSTLVYYESAEDVAEVELYNDLTKKHRSLLQEAIQKRFKFSTYVHS